jgi:hypothetical protein
MVFLLGVWAAQNNFVSVAERHYVDNVILKNGMDALKGAKGTYHQTRLHLCASVTNKGGR